MLDERYTEDLLKLFKVRVFAKQDDAIKFAENTNIVRESDGKEKLLV